MPDEKVNLEELNLGGVISGSPAQAKVYQGPDVPAKNNSQVAGTNMSFQDMFRAMTYNASADMGGGRKPAESVPMSSIYSGSRYASSRPFEEPMLEEMYARNQSGISQLVNGTLKMAGTFSSALAGGTAGLLYGINEFRKTGKFSSLFDNEANRMADDFTKRMEDALPNYVSQNERDANWWSPDYLLTPNFVADGLLKNLGYSYGTIVGGKLWVKALNSVGIIDKLVKAGKGLEAAAAIEKSMSGVPKLQRAAAFDNALNSIAQKYLRPLAANALKNSERILTSVTGTFGEAGLEGMNNANEFRKNAIDAYINTYGVYPTGDALKRIDEKTNEVGRFTWGFNTVLLSGTNYIQLPKILNSSRKADKALINDVEQKVLGGAFSEIVPETMVQKAVSRSKAALGLVFSPSEAFEEGAQFAIQTGVADYFNRADRNKKDTKDFLENLNGALGNVFSYGIDETIHTKEGMSNIILGGLSGGLQQSGIIGMYQNKEGKTRVGFGKSGEILERGWLGEGGERKENTDIALEALNATNIKQALADQAKYIGIGIGSQKGRMAAIKAGDVAGEKNFEHDYALSYVMPRVKYGKTQSIYNELDHYASQAATEEGFQELVSEGVANPNETKADFLDRLSNLRAITKQVNDTYDLLNDRYSTELNPEGKRKYTDDVIEKMVYATAKIGNYDIRIPQVNDNLVKNGIVTSDILESIITSNKPNKEATAEAVKQINELKVNGLPVLSEVKVGLKQDLADLIRLSLERKGFIDEYDAMKSKPEDFVIPSYFEFGESSELPVTVEQEKGKKKKTITSAELEVGAEYPLAEAIRKEGNKLIVAPKIAVLSQTLGGEFEVKLPNGEVDFLSPEEFKQFNISDSDNTDEEINSVIDSAIDKILRKSKYADISIPEGENKLDYINSLNNPALVDEIIKQVDKSVKELSAEKKKEEDALKEGETENKLLETLDNSNLFTRSNLEGMFEPFAKKEGEIAISSSIASKKIPGYERSMVFANSFRKMPNKDRIYGVYVTKANQDQLIPGLVEHLAQGKESVNVDTTIAVVMAQKNDDGSLSVVDQNGNVVTEDLLNKGIYQVMPLDDLKWSKEYGEESMLRWTVNEKQEAKLKQIYKKRRENILNNPDLMGYSFSLSMGILQTSDAPTSVIDANLIDENDLTRSSVLYIPTTGDILEKGSTYFTDPLGMVFLNHPDGYIRLQNKQNSEAEATAIYDVLYRLSNLVKNNNFESAEAQSLIDWLRSVVHWGTPEEGKTPGKNSVWFARDNNRTSDKFRVYFSETASFAFKASVLGQKKTRDEIIDILMDMYNNVSKAKAEDIETPYTQILSVSPTGETRTKVWENYQTYLLSSEGRTADQIPLTTDVVPMTSEKSYNRDGVYFIMSGFNDDSEFDDVELKKKTSKKVPTGTVSSVPFRLESTGETEDIQYTKDADGKVTIVDSEENEAAFQRLMEDDATAKKFDKKYAELYDDGIVTVDTTQIPLLELMKVVAKNIIEERGVKRNIPIRTLGQGGRADNAAAKLDELLNKKRSTKLTPKKGEEEEVEEEAPVVSDTEAKKAAILKGINNLEEEDKIDFTEEQLIELTNVIKPDNKISSTALQKIFAIGHNKASRIVEKINAELAALEGGKPATSTKDARKKSIMDDLKQFKKKSMKNNRDANLRIKLDKMVDAFQSEDWKEVEKFMKQNLPTIPVYRIKNIIQAIGGLEAWGAYQEGAIYVYENAEVGTAYHEVFHAVWDSFLTLDEKANIVLEFRGRKGSYVNRLGEKINYKDATIDQINEALAEEFREYKVNGKVIDKPTYGKSFIERMFIDLMNFIKSVFLGKKAQVETANLFKKMESGFYANSYNPYASQLALADSQITNLDTAILNGNAVFSLVGSGLSVANINDIMQELTYRTLIESVINTDEGLFSIESLNTKDLYDSLKAKVDASVYGDVLDWATVAIEQGKSKEDVAPIVANAKALRDNIFANWKEIVKKHKEEYLSSYDIKFDNNIEEFTNEYNKTGKGDEYNDSNQQDQFRKVNAAVKLLLATVPVLDENGYPAVSSINGVVLMPMGKVYVTLLNKLSGSRDIDEMFERLRLLSIEQPEYEELYSRLTNKLPNAVKDDYYKNINSLAGLQLVSAFYNAFDLQNPDVTTMFVLGNGEVSISDTTLANAADQIASELESGIIKSIKDDGKYFMYNGNSYEHKSDRRGVIELEKFLTGTLDTSIKFLNTLGANLNRSDFANIPNWKSKRFVEAVGGLKRSLEDVRYVRDISGKSLGINNRLSEIGEVIAGIKNPDFQTTFINVNGDLVQSFLGQNPLSQLYNFLSSVNKLDDLKGTRYEYLLTDKFTKGTSVLLSKIFDKEGNKKPDVDKYLKVGYTGGIVNDITKKKKSSSKVTLAERIAEELNLNLKGVYMNLVPGDASLGWNLFMGNHITPYNIATGNEAIHRIFEKYVVAEIDLSREGRKIPKVAGRETTDLRFFKGILGETVHKKIVAASEASKNPDASNYKSSQEIYNDFKDEIEKATNKFLEEDIQDRIKYYTEQGLVKLKRNGNYLVKQVALKNAENLSLDYLKNQIGALSANYMINNIELHKLIYSDPYQYEDEIKRIKSFSSPRQSIVHSSQGFNRKANEIVNEEYSIKDSQGNKNIGYTDMTVDHFNSILLKDNISINEALGYKNFKSTDGGGIITMKANRNLRIRSKNWNILEEKQYRYDIAYEKAIKGLPMSKYEKALYKEGSPNVNSAYTPVKPIVSGGKLNNKTYNDIVLDKFALYPFSFRVLHEMNPESNAIKLYNKMQAGNVDYAVFQSGRKVGGETAIDLYDKEGNFNDAPVSNNSITKIPFAIIGIQAEVPSKETGDVTRGSQVTKLVTLDFLDCGVPLDFEPGLKFQERLAKWNAITDEAEKMKASDIYSEINNYENLLNELTNIGYEQLLEDVGYNAETGLLNTKKLSNFLRAQVLKGNTDENIIKSIESLALGNKDVEATPAYSQIRNTLYSIARDSFISPTISGGLKVQIPSALLEAEKVEVKEVNGKKVLTANSDVLKFYTNSKGEVVAEIMLARWFKSDKTDAELLQYLNDTPEGQKILKGVAFRIPTQKQNSIDVIKIAKFLPESFSDAVVIPAGMVAKVGSDFDIDKLSIYLKNIVVDDKTGDINIVPFRGIGKDARDKFDSLEDYKKSIQNAYIESMEKLIANPLNFDRLVKPNNADVLKELSDELIKLRGEVKSDYSSVTNMLKQTLMISTRHSFVSGKYAIGIAAVAQTNHSLNQRGMVVIDYDVLTTPGDTMWLGNKRLAFEKFNKITIGNRTLPTLSKIKDANDEYEISDIIGMFIDGYVDVSKDDWVMKMGATPMIAGTWLTLIKAGVPIKTVGYFMNQPIIRDYIKQLESTGGTYLFSTDAVQEIKENPKYELENNKSRIKNGILTEASLKANVGRAKFDEGGKAYQQFVLGEFLKYAKMSEHLLRDVQSTNFDTTNINDPSLIYLMNEKVAANNSIDGNNLIGTSTTNILLNSFIGNIYDKMLRIRDIYGQVLISESKGNQKALENYMFDKYLSLPKDKFVDTARKILNSVFDYSVQMNQELNVAVGSILSGDDSVAKQMNDFIQEIKDEGEDHPMFNNLIVNSLQYTPANREGGADELKLAAKDNKQYDKNQIIYSFGELKSYMKSVGQEDLYKGLVHFSILQSGLINSPISFTSFIPYEDFVEVYRDSINGLNSSIIESFANIDAFERNNWNNPDIVGFKKAFYEIDDVSETAYYNVYKTLTASNVPANDAIKRGEIPQIISIPRNSPEGRKNFVVFSWEEGTEEEKKAMKDRGDFSYIRKGLFQKIKSELGRDFIVGTSTVVYKQINAWGDGMRANEFYDHARKSTFNNGFDPVEKEVDDATIRAIYHFTSEQKGYVPSELEQFENNKFFDNEESEEVSDTPFDYSEEKEEEKFDQIDEINLSLEDDNTDRNSIIGNMDYRKLYSEVKRVDSPTDARGLALEYFAGGGKIGATTLYNEVVAKRDERFASNKSLEEITSRDYVSKTGPTIKEIASSIWDNLSEEVQSRVDDQDIRNELIDVVSTYLKRQSIAKEFLRSYGPTSLEELDPNAALIKKYGIENINSKLLEGLGYTPRQISKILKEIC